MEQVPVPLLHGPLCLAPSLLTGMGFGLVTIVKFLVTQSNKFNRVQSSFPKQTTTKSLAFKPPFSDPGDFIFSGSCPHTIEGKVGSVCNFLIGLSSVFQ